MTDKAKPRFGSSHSRLVDLAREAAPVAFGNPEGAPADELDAALDAVATAFGDERRAPRSLHGRLRREMRAPVEESTRTADLSHAERVASARAQLGAMPYADVLALQDALDERSTIELNDLARGLGLGADS